MPEFGIKIQLMGRLPRSFILVVVCIAVLLAGFSSSARLRLCKKSGIFICCAHTVVQHMNSGSKVVAPESLCNKFHEYTAILSYKQIEHLFFHPPKPFFTA